MTMRRTLIRYAGRMLFFNWVIMLIGFVALLEVLDLLNNADSVLETHNGQLSSLMYYAALKLPEIASFILPFSVLLGGLVTLGRLSQNNEILALKAAGSSFYSILIAFTPVALGIALFHFVLADQIAPPASRSLKNFMAGVEEGDTQTDLSSSASGAEDLGIWLRDGQTLARINNVALDGRVLLSLVLIRLDEKGNLRERLTAASARWQGDFWVLYQVERSEIGNEPGSNIERLPALRWDTHWRPGHFADLALPPASLSLSDIWSFAHNPGVATHPAYYYEIWMYRRILLPFASILMILLAAPVAQSFQRQGGMMVRLAIGVGLGFLYFITDGVILAVGEAGVLPPILTAIFPYTLFTLIGGAALLRMEGW